MAEMVEGLGCAVESVDYQGVADPSDRVKMLLAECEQIHDSIILVGSSMGGHVATAGAESVSAEGLFVLAPAYFMEGYEGLTPDPPKIPICIVHGWHDDIVPVENSIRFAASCGATLHIVDGDHRLTHNIDEINQYLEIFIEDVRN
jgi:predicted esterase